MAARGQTIPYGPRRSLTRATPESGCGLRRTASTAAWQQVNLLASYTSSVDRFGAVSLRSRNSLIDEDLQREPSSNVGFSRDYLLLHSETRLSSSAFAPERFLRTCRQNGKSGNDQQPDHSKNETVIIHRTCLLELVALFKP